MRGRLISLISDHPIQQGIRKGGGLLFGHRQTRRGEDRMAYSRQLDWETNDRKCLSAPSFELLTRALNPSDVGR